MNRVFVCDVCGWTDTSDVGLTRHGHGKCWGPGLDPPADVNSRRRELWCARNRMALRAADDYV